MNNLIKNVAIWLVIAVVLMTVFNQFSSRQAAQSVIPYSQFMDEVKQGRVTSAQVEGRTVRWVAQDNRKYVTYSPGTLGDLWMVSDLLEGRRQGRREARGRAVVPDEHLHLVVPDAAPDRRLDILHAPDAGRRARRRVFVRQEPRAHDGRKQQHGDLRGRRGLRGSEGRSRGARRIPARSGQVPETRRAHSERRADGRFAGHRQDAARARDRRRGQGPVLQHFRLRLRRDVRRRGRRARARHVRAGEEACAVHRVHR